MENKVIKENIKLCGNVIEKAVKEFTENIYEELKQNCSTYGELEKQVNEMQKEVKWELCNKDGSAICRMVFNIMSEKVSAEIRTLEPAKLKK